MTEQQFHEVIIGEAFDDDAASAISGEHYYLRCKMMPCRCTCRACAIRSLQYCENEHLTEPKGDGRSASQTPNPQTGQAE